MSHFYPDIHMKRLGEALARLKRDVLLDRVTLDARYARTPEPVAYAARRALPYKPIREGMRWGGTWDCGWFHLTGRVPKAWKGDYVVAVLDFGGEALVFDAAGCPRVGLTNGSVFDGHYNKDTFHIFPSCKGGERVDLWVDTACNGLFGVTRCGDPAWCAKPEDVHGRWEGTVNKIRLHRFDEAAWQLWLDLQVIENLCRDLPDTSVRKIQLLRIASRALDAMPAGGAAASRKALAEAFSLPTDPATVDVYGVGHAHIDTAWLWPLRETIRKCGRTFASQVGLIERYPGYVFGASQAQLYAFTKHHYPKLYAKIRKAVAAGRWEVQGGMWVEADCNLIGGESMVRQCLVGKTFFWDEFGIDVKNLWLPDVFGYSGNLPQILKKAGIDYFLTQKMSWNRYNKFPHNTFRWRGIDGSEVLAHFPPEDNYNSAVEPASLRRNESNNAERGLVQEAICLYGIGNGGGGPKEEHVERALRLRNLNGCPRFHFGHAQQALEKMAARWADLDVWQGELYFELHRATLTTQAGVKRWNRRAEEALRAAEMLCAAAGLAKYPRAAFDALWKTTLLNQFHDIIPGSSIHRVYEETVPQLQGVVDGCKALQAAAAARALAKAVGSLTLFNPSSTPFAGVVTLPGGWPGAARDGEALPAQREGRATVAWATVPPCGFATLTKAADPAPRAKTTSGLVLENDDVRYTFDADLRVVEGFDKRAGVRFIEKNAPGNRLDLYDDHPAANDAWDIDEYYRKMRVGGAKAVSVRRVAGPVRQGFRATLRVGESVIAMTVWLGREGRRLDFICDVDWHERHKLLRVAFPTVIEAPAASFEIQYGVVTRPTHDNTKWDVAQFEGAGHRYADLSRADYGVALLNDSKYGYRVKGRELSLSLLRAPTEPDPVADIGRHQFTYSVLPHAGNLAASDVAVHAAILNQGVERFEGRAAEAVALPVTLAGDGLELAVLKKAERGEALIVRVVETRGVNAAGTLTCADKRAKIVETDLMERSIAGRVATGKRAIACTPFEIQTFKIA